MRYDDIRLAIAVHIRNYDCAGMRAYGHLNLAFKRPFLCQQ